MAGCGGGNFFLYSSLILLVVRMDLPRLGCLYGRRLVTGGGLVVRQMTFIRPLWLPAAEAGRFSACLSVYGHTAELQP